MRTFLMLVPVTGPTRSRSEARAAWAGSLTASECRPRDAGIGAARGSPTVHAAGQTIVLRALLHDQSGGLWILWTGGNPPAGSLPVPVKVQDFAKPRAFGLKGFVAPTPGAKRVAPAPSIGERLNGMGLAILDKNLTRITLDIPVLDSTGKKKLGTAHFKNIPVRKIGMIWDFSYSLGLRERL